VRIADIGVAGVGPLAAEGAARLVALVPVALCGAGSLDDQLAGFTIGSVGAVLGDDAQLVFRDRLAGGAVADVVRTVRQENVQHLGRAEPVEDVGADRLMPAPADMLGQWL